MKDLHLFLKRFRVLAVSIILFFAVLTWDMWDWYQFNHKELTIESAGVFGSIILLAGGALKFALQNIMGRHESDD